MKMIHYKPCIQVLKWRPVGLNQTALKWPAKGFRSPKFSKKISYEGAPGYCRKFKANTQVTVTGPGTKTLKNP